MDAGRIYPLQEAGHERRDLVVSSLLGRAVRFTITREDDVVSTDLSHTEVTDLYNVLRDWLKGVK